MPGRLIVKTLGAARTVLFYSIKNNQQRRHLNQAVFNEVRNLSKKVKDAASQWKSIIQLESYPDLRGFAKDIKVLIEILKNDTDKVGKELAASFQLLEQAVNSNNGPKAVEIVQLIQKDLRSNLFAMKARYAINSGVLASLEGGVSRFIIFATTLLASHVELSKQKAEQKIKEKKLWEMCKQAENSLIAYLKKQVPDDDGDKEIEIPWLD
jgi:hypothetical protein